MTREQQPTTGDPPEEGKQPVTANELAAVEVEAPLRDTRNLDCQTLGGLYHTAATQAQEDGNTPAGRIFGLLSEIANIHFKPEDRAEPYGPQCVMDGRRSMVPSDLRGEQSAALAEIVPTLQNSGFRARLADIVWYIDRKRAPMARQAINAYCESVETVLSRNGEFFNEDQTASGYDGSRMLCRACQIAHATGWKDPESSRLKALIATVARDTVVRQDHCGFFNIASIALQFAVADPIDIATGAETFAASEDVDPHSSHDLWEIAARSHQSSGDQKERARCLAEAAESYVAIAEAAGGEGMVAAGFFMDAIAALRRLPNTKPRRQELEERLRQAQASVSDEMGVISAPFDLSEYIQHARQSVGGTTLGAAIGAFASLAASPEPDDLWNEARRTAEDFPLSSMMPSTVVDDEGRVVAKSPGMLGDSNARDTALRYLISRHEALRRQTDVQGLIKPGRHLIQSEHLLDQSHLRLLMAWTPCVPADRVDLVTTGLARFFGGDYFSALHILVPQLEHSLRHILKQAGMDPSTIHSDMTQEVRTLSVMLDKERGALQGILGAAIVFEIENLFDLRAGPSLRHQVAHGLVSAGDCYATDAIYACWFIFRFFCLPLFPHWEEATEHLHQM
ncbi:MAG: hypothetical protein OXC25_07720 [Thiotrichales bacterium]|nr:hypothetical protein [Thiotrichales bacterium]